MKKTIHLFWLLFFGFSAFAQKKDSTFLSIGKKAQLVDTLLLTQKDSVGMKKDTLKKKNFFAARAESFSKWSPPKKAALMSFVLPGSGQIYNKKGIWWRLPLCYGAYGTTIYLHAGLRKKYFFYRDAYSFKVANPSKKLPTSITNRSPNKNIDFNLVDLEKIYRQRNTNRDTYERSFIWLGAAHLYCVADAFVTAHLNAFDISDDLSLKVQPKFDWLSQKPMLGLTLGF
jgi:hypothetical protein